MILVTALLTIGYALFAWALYLIDRAQVQARAWNRLAARLYKGSL